MTILDSDARGGHAGRDAGRPSRRAGTQGADGDPRAGTEKIMLLLQSRLLGEAVAEAVSTELKAAKPTALTSTEKP